MTAKGVVIGKRIVFGQIVSGLVTTGAFIWDAMNPDMTVPAGPLMAMTQAVTGIGQVILVNKFGVTQVPGA